VTREDLEQWLKNEAPGDLNATAAYVYGALRRAHDPYNSNYNPVKNDTAFLILKNWAARPEAVSEDDIWDTLDRVHDEAEKAAKAEAERELERRRIASSKWEAARRRERAEEERLKRVREHHAENVRKCVARFGCTTRYAQMMLRDGVKQMDRARELAELLGGDPAHYLRRKAKSGKQPDLAAMLLRARPAGISLRDYADDDTDLQGDARAALFKLYDVLDECRKFEQFLLFARERGIEVDTAHFVWLSYQKWHVEAVADRASQQVQDEIDRLFDFG
jgi:hypothetical protein